MYMVVVSHQTRGRVGVLDDASAVHFNLLDEVLNIPLHGVPVRFDRAKLNMVLAATRFETVVIFKFGAIVAYAALGVCPQNVASSSRCCQMSSRVRVLMLALMLDPISSTTSACALPFSLNVFCPMTNQSMCHSSRGVTARFRMPPALRNTALYRSGIVVHVCAFGACSPCVRARSFTIVL
jgi:hypothetical protein